MPLINCKVELKLKWTKYCILSATGNDNANDNTNNITRIYIYIYIYIYMHISFLLRRKIICSSLHFISR